MFKLQCFQVLYPYAAGGNHLCNLLSTHTKFYPRFYTNTDYHKDLLDRYLKKLGKELNFKSFTEYNKYNSADIKTESDMLGALSLYYNAHIWDGNPIGEFILKEYNGYSEIVMNHNSFKIHVCVPEAHLKSFEFDKFFISQTHSYDMPFSAAPKEKTLRKVWHIINNEDKKGIVMTYPKNYGRAGKRCFFANDIHNKKKYNFGHSFTLPFYNKYRDEIFNSANALLIDSNKFCEEDGSLYLQTMVESKYGLTLPNVIHDLHSIWCKIVDKSIEIAENK